MSAAPDISTATSAPQPTSTGTAVSAFAVYSNGPDLAAARMLPPGSSIENGLNAGLEFARRGLSPDIQERLHGTFRRLEISDLKEILQGPDREEKMMLSAAAQMLSPAGPPTKQGFQLDFGASPRGDNSPSDRLRAHRTPQFKPSR